MDRISELKKIAYKKIRMNDNYRFFNSNYNFNDNIVPFFKHSNIVENLKSRIKYSKGGAFLITGLRGVGKTTLVKRAISELQSKEMVYLSVYINLSKEFEYRDILFEIVRRLYETIKDSKLMYEINDNIWNQIVLAYSRTSMAISKRNMIGADTEFSIENQQLLKRILLKSRVSFQAAEEASFLAYSQNDIEHDLIRIIELLHDYKAKKIKVIIIFDELDKITPSKSGNNFFEKILSGLKSIICSVDAISIFIGGVDLYQKWNDDTAKIDSLYDSIFSWHQYVPCIWDAMESLFDLLTEKEFVYQVLEEEFQFICRNKYSNIIKPSFKSFLTYLNFKSKGIPRKIYSEFNKFVIWKDEIPYFEISDIDIYEINAYYNIWKKISVIFEETLYKTVIEMDLTYMTCFNMIEYFFAYANDEFTIKDVEKKLLYNSIGSVINIKHIIKNLMNKFIEQHLIQETFSGKFIVTDLTIKKEENVVVKDKAILHDNIDDKQSNNRNDSVYQDPNASFRRKLARYESHKIDSFWESFIAKELLEDTFEMTIFYVINNTNVPYIATLYKDKGSQKLQNKNCIYQQSSYKLISKYLFDTVDIVIGTSIKTSLQEISDGYLLSHIIESKIKIEYIFQIIEQVLLFIIELRDNGYFNANIKANNIIVDKNLNIKFLDVKNLTKKASKDIPINTIGYSAPEMYTDNYNHLCDIYSVGVLLWEMVNHKCISKLTFKRHIDFDFLERPKDCSRKLWKIILKATKFAPNERYKSAEEFLQDIYSCRKYRNKVFKNRDYSIGTVTNIYSTTLESVSKKESKEFTNDTIMNETVLLDSLEFETMMLGNKVVESKKSYLIRLNTNEMISINKEEFIIGKEKSRVDYCIHDNNAISRVHAQIITRDNRYYLVDFGSANKTFLNDVEIQSNTQIEINTGDIIKFSNEIFTFYVE